jgi:hypothetical protein
MAESHPRTRKLTIIAQDPSVKAPVKENKEGSEQGEKERILTTQLEIPAEDLMPGPRGYRVIVVDYDTSSGTLYMPIEYKDLGSGGQYEDPFFDKLQDKDGDDALLNDPNFHSQNVYAIVMRTLARFEFALGRRVNWGFEGHQIYIAPHAFADANAFYSENDRALCFGYFPSNEKNANGRKIFTCLSHDVVAHETTHALLDGLRQRFTDPSSPDQAGFHEGFADVVALLSIFSLKDVMEALLPMVEKVADERHRVRKGEAEVKEGEVKESVVKGNEKEAETQKIRNFVSGEVNLKKVKKIWITKKSLTPENLRASILFGMAEQMGEGLSGKRGSALRRSVDLMERKDKANLYEKDPEFKEPHRRGELIVAAVMNSFLEVWLKRLEPYLEDRDANSRIDVNLIIDEGASAANQLLTMVIRALDYTPPTDLSFGDFLSALLTADTEVVPDDSKYGYRKVLLQNFKDLGIKPSSLPRGDGTWEPLDKDKKICYDRTHFESLLHDPNEAFRFIWDNRKALEINEDAYTEVQSIRPSLRIAPDGFALHETVVVYVQMVTLRAIEVEIQKIAVPTSMPDDQEVTLFGGGTLIFDEYGRVKYHIRNKLYNLKKQTDRLKYLWLMGYVGNKEYRENLFARMHLQKSLGVPPRREEQF